MGCTFNDVMHEVSVKVRLDTQNIPKRNRFRYVGSIMQGSGYINNDITHRIGMAWMNWRLASRILCDAKVPRKIRSKF